MKNYKIIITNEKKSHPPIIYRVENIFPRAWDCSNICFSDLSRSTDRRRVKMKQ